MKCVFVLFRILCVVLSGKILVVGWYSLEQNIRLKF